MALDALRWNICELREHGDAEARVRADAVENLGLALVEGLASKTGGHWSGRTAEHTGSGRTAGSEIEDQDNRPPGLLEIRSSPNDLRSSQC